MWLHNMETGELSYPIIPHLSHNFQAHHSIPVARVLIQNLKRLTSPCELSLSGDF